MEFTTDIVIGLEIHVELKTKTKLFCGCATTGDDEPNTRTCPVCLGHPGSKPVLNAQALDHGMKICLALNSSVAPQLIFSRKSYFYPDLSKNYQISQYELPLGTDGAMVLSTGEEIRLIRIHLEEDPASLVHPGDMRNASYVLVDYNRSGNPLAEIVTQPDMSSPDQARDFMKELITVLDYLNVFDVNHGIIKADANISLKGSDYTRVEVKNITGFKELERALHYEIERQQKETSEGKPIVQETRGWDANTGSTFSMRTKETEDDYGYIIDPDLVPISITKEKIQEIEKTLPELAASKREKYAQEHGLEETTANVLSKNKDLAGMYEEVSAHVDSQLASKWIRRELARILNYHKKSLQDSGISSQHMVSLLKLIEQGRITEKTAQRIIEQLGQEPFDVEKHVKEQGLEVMNDTGQLESICKEVIGEHESVVQDYHQGGKKALNFLVGQVMKKTQGKAKPKDIIELLTKLLS